jgi:hypothetical protein
MCNAAADIVFTTSMASPAWPPLLLSVKLIRILILKSMEFQFQGIRQAPSILQVSCCQQV